MLLFILEWIIWFLSVLPVGVLQAWPGLVKGQVWPLHPIRLWLISLFEERDEKRHWAWCNPLPPPVFPPPGYPSTCCGFVCGFGRALAFSKKPAVTTHFSTMRTHSSWHKGWKSCLPQSTPFVWLEMPPEQGLGHEGTLNIPLKVILVKFSKLWLHTGRGQFHCRFYSLQRRILPHHSGMMSLLRHLIQK